MRPLAEDDLLMMLEDIEGDRQRAVRLDADVSRQEREGELAMPGTPVDTMRREAVVTGLGVAVRVDRGDHRYVVPLRPGYQPADGRQQRGRILDATGTGRKCDIV